jgi:uncharacterized protein
VARFSIADEKRKFQEGFDHFNRKEFFEAHESWEEIWLHAPKPEKPFLQGIIQVAAAFHHYRRGNREGCESLLGEGLRKLDKWPAVHRGLALAPLRLSVRWWLAELHAGRVPVAKHIPHLEHAKHAG